MIESLDDMGISRRTISLIPFFKHPDNGKHYPLDRDEDISLMLEEEKIKGNDFMLHGFDHSKGKGMDREFKKIGYDEAGQKINDGMQLIKSMGLMLYPLGFAAPFWKLSSGGRKAVKDADFRYIEHNEGLEDLTTGQFFASKALWCWPYNGFLDTMFQVYDKFLALEHKNNELIRVALHPQDIRNDKTFEFEMGMIEELRKDRELVTYHQYLLPKRLASF